MANNTPNNVDAELIQTFMQEFTTILQQVNATVRSLETSNGLTTAVNADQLANAINALFRAVHTIKGDLQLIKLNDLAVTAHKLEDVLTQIREDNSKYKPEFGKALCLSLQNIMQATQEALQPKKSLMHVIMEINRETGALFAQSWVDEFNIAIKQLYQARNSKKQ